MLRADNVLCNTSTTGTGTLTLAACTDGGLDFDKWLKATGFNFVSGNAVLVSYTIIEYTSSTPTTPKQEEKGIGTLTLGASITAATLARTKVQSTVTGMDTSTPSPTFSAPTAITIGTAANTRVFVGASAADVLAFQPCQDTALTSNGFLPLMVGNPTTGGGGSLVNNQDWTQPFIWTRTTLVKRIYVRVEAGYSGAVSNLYARLYQVNASGQQQGKLLYDFGVIGTANSSLNVSNFTMISSGAAGNGFLLTPGEYFLQICPIWTAGGTGTPALTIWGSGSAPISSGFRGSAGVGPQFTTYDNSANATAPDPAPAAAGPVSFCPCFFLAES